MLSSLRAQTEEAFLSLSTHPTPFYSRAKDTENRVLAFKLLLTFHWPKHISNLRSRRQECPWKGEGLEPFGEQLS